MLLVIEKSSESWEMTLLEFNHGYRWHTGHRYAGHRTLTLIKSHRFMSLKNIQRMVYYCCAGCYLPVICQWLCPERSSLFLISFSWTQYRTLNTIIYLVHCIDILLYIPRFISILNDLWRGGEAKLLSAMAKWQITGAR